VRLASLRTASGPATKKKKWLNGHEMLQHQQRFLLTCNQNDFAGFQQTLHEEQHTWPK